MTHPQGSPQEQIAAEILDVHEASYGASASEVIVHLLEDVVVVLIDGLELTKSEQILVDNGESQAVLGLRASFQRAIEPTFSAIIERATGRRVRTFLSNTDLTALLSVEFFRLHPAAA